MLILASQSQRRKDLLNQFGYTFKVMPADIDETMDSNLSAYENCKRVAELKASCIFEENQNDVVLASDTIVTLDNVIYGKPADKSDAYNMLRKFSGNTHEVVSAVCIMSGTKTHTFYVVSKVTFKDLSDEEIYDYLSTDEPWDKAGSYAIQGIAGKFVSKFEGSLNNIIGLPIEECVPYLDELLGDK